MHRLVVLLFVALSPLSAAADEPAVSYIFPAGGQRGSRVDFRVGGLYLHEGAAFEMIGPGVAASPRIVPTETVWFEGPLLPVPASQQKEDYPKDYAGHVDIAADALLGARHWRVSTSQGVTPSMKFVVGDLPEVIEQEIDGEPLPVAVTLPVTINGRVFPREDVDDWTFTARRGELIRAEVLSARLGSPLEARLVLYDSGGNPLAEDVGSLQGDACLRVAIPADGVYRLRIHDVNFSGLQHYVYRLTVTNGPYVERVYPLGGRRGSTLRLELEGLGLPSEAVEVAIASDAPSWFAPCLIKIAGQSGELGLEIDDLPELLECEPNNSRPHAAPLAGSMVCNGRIGAPGDIDYWQFTAKNGESLDILLSARRLGSPLDPVLVVEDATGKELSHAEESTTSQSDARLRFTAPADGAYRVRVADRFASRGGSAFGYRLRVAPAGPPDFRLILASDALTLYRNAQAKLRVTCERIGEFAGPITLAVEGLPTGISIQGGEIAANQQQADITFKAADAAKIATSHLTVRGTGEIGGKPTIRTAALAARPGETVVDCVLLAVSMPTPFKVQGKYDLTFVARGSALVRHYTIDRGGYSGPLTVQLADRQARHLQGVTGPVVTMPPDWLECDYPVFLPPWMELGRTSRSVVMAVGVVTDSDGSRHTVSFTSQNQNEQIVALVGPGELSVQTEPSSLHCSPGGEAELRVRIARNQSLNEPSKVELIVPPHIHGITADAVTVAPQVDEAVLRIRCAAVFGPLNMPVTIRATNDRDGRPVVAETKLELVSGSGKP
jgi:hypothetical protein